VGHVGHLLGPYHDNELAQGTRRLVEEHVRTCEHCRAELSNLEALSRTLASYPVPEPVSTAQQFQSQVLLRLTRRGRAVPVGGGWLYLVPLALSCAMVGLLALFSLPGILEAMWMLIEWAGIAPASLPTLPTAFSVSGETIAVVLGVGSLAWEAILYALLLVVFASYVGWVGVLWHGRARSQLRKER
jgi:predicted anti-sigma-YlaC factor YlaD